MKQKLLFTAMCLFLLPFANAQEETSKINYANITEFGIVSASPWGVALEASSINGISIDKHHVIGIGFGIGYSFHKSYVSGIAYTPIYANYRYYFRPDKNFTPHINTALGTLYTENGWGLYSLITAGFKAKRFSFSSGLSIMGVQNYAEEYVDYVDIYRNTTYTVPVKTMKWHYPFGFVIKCGFSF